MKRRIEKIIEVTGENPEVIYNRYYLGYDVGHMFTFDELFALMDWQSEEAWKDCEINMMRSVRIVRFDHWLEDFNRTE